MKIIGIGGTNGSGKDTVAQMLAERHNWLVVQYSDFLRDEARKRGLPIERKNLSAISAEWRAEYGHDIMTERAAELFKKTKPERDGLVVLSIRHPGEAERVKELGGVLVWVDADPKLRYERIKARGRSMEDSKTNEQFLEEELAETHHHGGDDTTIGGYKVEKMADIFIENNGNDIEAFKDEVEKKLAPLL